MGYASLPFGQFRLTCSRQTHRDATMPTREIYDEKRWRDRAAEMCVLI